MLCLTDATPDTICQLLTDTHDWQTLSDELIAVAKGRVKVKAMEEHHIEPAREEIIFLFPLEHLAIHICEAKLFPSDSSHAKVGAFVKPFPGSYRRIVTLPDKAHDLVLSFGQTRPSKTAEEMARIANLPQAKLAQQETGKRTGAENGKKSAPKVSAKLKGREITWGEKISSEILARGAYTCETCGKQMKDIPGNILQHQRSPRCIPQ
jgi:hypothetical protein